jgi:hypothetical protein
MAIIPLSAQLTGTRRSALAAWQPPTRVCAPNLQGWSMLLVPGAFIVTAIALRDAAAVEDQHLVDV